MTNLLEANTDLPHNLSAEHAVISCCLLQGNSDAYDSISRILKSNDFYSLQHQLAFQGIADLANDGQPVDEIHLVEKLKVNTVSYTHLTLPTKRIV